MRKEISDLINLKKANDFGLNRHFGKDSARWNDGNRLEGNFPCPQCGKDRVCEKRNAYRICEECFRIRPSKFNKKEWYRRTRLTMKRLAIEYLGGKCVSCGKNDLHISCYCFHHKDSNKKEFSIAKKFTTVNFEKIRKELDKCVLMCQNCHSIEHWDE